MMCYCCFVFTLTAARPVSLFISSSEAGEREFCFVTVFSICFQLEFKKIIPVYLQGLSSALGSRGLAGLSAESSPPAPALWPGARWRTPAAVCSSAADRRSPPELHPSPAAERPVSAAPPPAWRRGRTAASPADLQPPAESWWSSGVRTDWRRRTEKWLDRRLDRGIGKRRKSLFFYIREEE